MVTQINSLKHANSLFYGVVWQLDLKEKTQLEEQVTLSCLTPQFNDRDATKRLYWEEFSPNVSV